MTGTTTPPAPMSAPAFLADDRGWRSWHLHVASFAPGALDDVVTDVLRPLADRFGLLAPDGPAWFFLRYWQGGPHLRLRLHGLDAASTAAVETFAGQHLRLMDDALPADRRLDQAGYLRAVAPVAAAGEGGRALPAGELLAPGVHRAVYAPEYERYGGPALMGLTEDLFHHSSRLALRVCLARAGSRHALGSVLEATAAAGSVLEAEAPGSLAPFLTAQQHFWTQWRHAGTPAASPLPPPSAAALGPLGHRLRVAMRDGDPRWAGWTDPLAAASRRWHEDLGAPAAARILGSHLHMTANRLGAGAEREAQVAALLLAVLESPG